MNSGIYHIVIIVVAVWAVFTGYKRGFFRQIGEVLAVVTGIVVVRICASECYEFADEAVPGFVSGFNRPFLVKTLTCTILYVVVYSIIALITMTLGKLINVVGGDILNSIGGAVFRLFQWLIFLSLAYNLIADMSPSGTLTRSSRLHDGNVVEGVIKIAPAVLGFPDAEEVGHYQQLEDAKKIS